MSIDITGIDHFSLTVADLERSARFYMQFGYRPEPPYEAAGEEVSKGTGIPDARLTIQILRRSDGAADLELIRYGHGAAGRAAPHWAVGAAHVCFRVSDVHAAVAELRAAGAEAISDPHVGSHGEVWVYLRDPDGNAVELIQ